MRAPSDDVVVREDHAARGRSRRPRPRPCRRRSRPSVTLTTPRQHARDDVGACCRRRRSPAAAGAAAVAVRVTVTTLVAVLLRAVAAAGGDEAERRGGDERRRALTGGAAPTAARARPRRARAARRAPSRAKLSSRHSFFLPEPRGEVLVDGVEAAPRSWVAKNSPPVAWAICRSVDGIGRHRAREAAAVDARRSACRARPCRPGCRTTWRAPRPRAARACRASARRPRAAGSPRAARPGRAGRRWRRRGRACRRRRRNGLQQLDRAGERVADRGALAERRAELERLEHELAVVRQRRGDERLGREGDEADAVLARHADRGSAGSPPARRRGASA